MNLVKWLALDNVTVVMGLRNLSLKLINKIKSQTRIAIGRNRLTIALVDLAKAGRQLQVANFVKWWARWPTPVVVASGNSGG